MTADKPECDELIEWLTVRIARRVGMRPDAVKTDVPLADYGVDSIAGMALCADLHYEKGFDVETTIVWDYPTIDEIAAHLTEQRAPR